MCRLKNQKYQPKTAGPALGVERKSQQQQQQVCEKAQLTFIVAMYSMNEDAEYCLSLLKRIPDQTWDQVHAAGPYQDHKLVMCWVIANHPPDHHHQRQRIHLLSTRARRELSLHLRQQRLQLLSSSDGGFNYITAAKAAKAANHMVCKTVSSTWNSDSVVVLYRGGPRV